MKRLWKLLTSKDGGGQMLLWAAESRVGAVCLVLTWLGCHVAVGFGISGLLAGKSYLEVVRPEVIAGAIALVLVDTLLLIGVFRHSRSKSLVRRQRRRAH